MATPQAPRVVIFAGPNGAGKSTHADAIVAALDIHTFMNADYIARGLSGRHANAVAMQAGRIMLMRLEELATAKQDFSFESTLSSRSFAPFLRQLKTQGYRVAIYYFSMTSASLAVRRVKLRVAMDGHDVSEDTVRRRFGRSLHNFYSLYVRWLTAGSCLIFRLPEKPRWLPYKTVATCKSRNPSHGSNCKSS